jgi:hypothetical protein
MVVATVRDLGVQNRSILSVVKVSPANPSFKYPVNDDLLMFLFADVPHLLILLRNFLDEGFLINVEAVSERCVQQFLSV